MPFDLRRCAEAAAHAALAEAFARSEPDPPPRRKRRLGPLRAVLIGAGVVTTVRLVLRPDIRRALADAVASRLPLEEMLNDLGMDELGSDENLDLDSGGDDSDDARPQDEVEEDPEEDESEPEDEDEAEDEPARPRAAANDGGRRGRRA